MTLATFFEKFALFADAPDAVPRMRRLVLDLAVQGKLVPQNSKDEPAVELLRRVQVEKARLVKDGEIKKQQILPPVPDDALSFSLPSGWVATQLGDIAVCLDYMREPINGTERDLRIAGKSPSELFPYYGATQQQGWIDDFIFDAELVLLGEDGVPFFEPLRSKAYLISGKTWVNNHAHVFRGILVSNAFLMHWLNTFDYTGRVAGSTRSKLNQAKAVDIPIPLPPLAEQKRIVAKVDELMALCDRLEAEQQERETRQAALSRASLARFADAPTSANLHYLFHGSFSIPPADLRKSILTLAVQGKLAPQDPNDEPAIRLLERIDLEPKRAMRTRAAEDTEGEAPSELEPLYEIPKGWEWTQFRRLPLQASVGIDRGRSMQGPDKAVGYFKMNNIRNSGGIDLSDLTRIDATSEEVETYALADGDFLFNTRNSRELVGKTCVFRPPSNDPVLYNNNILRAKFIEGFSPDFLDYWFRSPQGSAELEKLKSNTTNVCAIYQGKLSGFQCPIPPLAEQRRIVAKVDELMALVDALETQLATARTTAARLLEAALAHLTSPAPADESDSLLLAAEDPAPYHVGKNIDLHASPEFIRAVLAAEIVDRLRNDRYCGQVKLQKILYLIEYHFRLPEIQSHPLRYAAGPHDPALIRQVEEKMRENEWFAEGLRPGGKGHYYTPLAHAGAHRDMFERLWHGQSPEIRTLIDEMKTWNTERCERFATVYAAWNDLLIWGEKVTDAAILREVLERWHSDKLQIPKSSWQETLQWMREHNYIPKGFGRATAPAPQPEFIL